MLGTEGYKNLGHHCLGLTWYKDDSISQHVCNAHFCCSSQTLYETLQKDTKT